MNIPFTLDERKALVAAMSEAFKTSEAVDQFTLLCFGVRFHASAIDASLHTRIFAVLSWAEDGNMVHFLTETGKDETLSSRTLASRARTILEAVKKRAPKGSAYTPPTPYETCLLQNCDPFINRTSLRQTIQNLLISGRKAVLLVNSERRKMGRSYTIGAMEDLGKRSRSFRVAWEDTKKHASSQISAAELYRSLSVQMKLPKLEYQREEAEPRFANFLATSLEAAAKDRSELWMIVLKGFDSELLPDETRQFISHLIERITPASMIRLVLIGYEKTDVPPDAIERVEEDFLSAPDVKELTKYFHDIHAHAARAISEDDAKKLAEKVFSSADATNDGFYARVSAEVAKEIAHLL